jgi:hypothetical protein
MAALHMQGHIVPGVSLPEEDILSTKSIQAKIFTAK